MRAPTTRHLLCPSPGHTSWKISRPKEKAGLARVPAFPFKSFLFLLPILPGRNFLFYFFASKIYLQVCANAFINAILFVHIFCSNCGFYPSYPQFIYVKSCHIFDYSVLPAYNSTTGLWTACLHTAARWLGLGCIYCVPTIPRAGYTQHNKPIRWRGFLSHENNAENPPRAQPESPKLIGPEFSKKREQMSGAVRICRLTRVAR
jgi:hypothetical protein